MTQAPNIRLSKALGGGPVGDVGIYCINAARYLTGEEPAEVTAFATGRRTSRGSARCRRAWRSPSGSRPAWSPTATAASTRPRAACYRVVGTEG